MHELSWGILAGLGCGLNWAVTSLLVRGLLARFSPAGINAVRAAGGGGILIALAVASGQGPAMLHAPLWTLLALGSAIVVGMVVGDSLFFRSMEALGVTRALTLSLLNPLLSTLTGIALYYYPRSVLPLIKQYVAEGNNPDQPGRLVQWLYTRVPVHTWRVPGLWFDIGSKESLEEANGIFASLKS